MHSITCRTCGHAYAASSSGADSCPRCGVPHSFSGVHPPPAGEASGRRVGRTALGNHILLTVIGPVYKIQELEELRSEIDAALGGEPDSMAFHFDRASYLDSSMLAQLVRTVQEMTRRGKPTFVITGDSQVLESLQTTDLDRVLTVCHSLQAYRDGLKPAV